MADESKTVFKVVGGVLFTLIALILIFGSWGTVGAGERGVKTRFGAILGTVPQGIYFKIPLIDRVHIMDVRTRTINYDKNGTEGDAADTSQLFGASRDLQDVKIGVVVNYHLDPNKVQDIYSQYSSVENYEANVIEPVVRQVVKSTSAQYTAEELVTKRAAYSDRVNTMLNEELTQKSAVLEQFSVTNFEFSAAFSQAIEAKVTATQNAEAAKNKLEQIKFEAEQTVVKAKADAEAVQIKSQAIAQQGGKEYVQLQWIDAWKSGGAKVPETIMGQDAGNFLFNINNTTK